MPQKNNSITVCVPTAEEMEVIQSFMGSASNRFDWHITGVGSFATAYHVTKLISKQEVDQIIHVGIAGAYDSNLSIGEVVEVQSEKLADFGAEDGDMSHVAYHGIVPSVDENTIPWSGGKLINPASQLIEILPFVDGLTVPFASGSKNTIERRVQSQAQIESMEGAGLFYTCLSENIPFHSLRAISNYVEVRNRAAWDIRLALDNLAEVLLDIS